MERLPSGSYRTKVEWKDESGKRHSKSFTARTKREANELAQEFKLSIKRKRSTLTVGEAIDRLIEINDSVYSPSTPRTYQKIKRNQMKNIVNTKLSDLNDVYLQRWINDISKYYAPKSVSCAYGLLNTICTQFEPEARFHVRLPKRTKTDIEIPQPSDIALLIEETKGSPIYVCVLLGAHCGLRRSEMSALSWDDIDLDRKKIRISKAMVQGEDNLWYIKQPKSYAGYRVLDMSDELFNYFLEADKEKPPVGMNPNMITKEFGRACQKINMPYHTHLLRHYFCSVCCMLGIPESITVSLMGHSDSTMIHQVYSHVLNDFEQEARSKIIDYLNK